jgi:hypothetical protein
VSNFDKKKAGKGLATNWPEMPRYLLLQSHFLDCPLHSHILCWEESQTSPADPPAEPTLPQPALPSILIFESKEWKKEVTVTSQRSLLDFVSELYPLPLPRLRFTVGQHSYRDCPLSSLVSMVLHLLPSLRSYFPLYYLLVFFYFLRTSRNAASLSISLSKFVSFRLSFAHRTPGLRQHSERRWY